MKKKTIIYLLLIPLLTAESIMVSCSTSLKNPDDLYTFAQSHLNDLRLSTYVTAQAVQTELADDDGLREAVSVFRSFGITKAYVEVYRSGLVVEPELLKTVRDHLQANGIEVAGGIATVPGKNFGVRQEAQLGWFNWQAKKTQNDLERVMRQSAPIFKEFIVDDFLCTADTSVESDAARGERSWGEYRRDLLTELSQRIFIDAAREENPDITMIIKYPQWYDRFHLFGYDVVREPQIFDRVWVGTETRGPDTQRMGFVKQYEGFVNYRWLSSLSGDKIGGAWFDHIDCNKHDFIEQAYQTVLAGAREIILFNYFDFINGHQGHHLLRRQFPKLVKIAQKVRQKPAWGVYGYKPPHSDAGGDLYVFDYLGMMGIPLVPCSKFPADAKVIFLPTQAASDPEIESHVQRFIQNGGTVIVTAGLLKSFAMTPTLASLIGIEEIETTQPLKATTLMVMNKSINFEKGLDIETILHPKSAEVVLTAKVGRRLIPFLTCLEHHTGGKVYVLNSHTFSEKDFKAVGEVLLAPRDLPLLDLPDEWLSEIRKCFNEPLGIEFKAPSRTAIHLLGENDWVFSNFNNDAVDIELSCDAKPNATFIDVFTGEEIQPNKDGFKLVIGKREIIWTNRL